MKKILALLVLAPFLISCAPETPTPAEELVSAQCVFPGETEKKIYENGYPDIFGTEESQTYVCGYLISEEEDVFGEMQTNVYLEISEFFEESFKDAILAGIVRGNTVNKEVDGRLRLNLGCLVEGKIEGVQFQEDSPYIDENTTEKLLNSSPENPISLSLEFGIHEGFGCDCCNLAHKIRVYEP